MARVLVVDDDPASRLTLQTLLQAGGYSVDSAASAAEAVDKMDEQQYELVLSDVGMESPEAGYRVIQHAKTREYRPATALLKIYRSDAKSNNLRDVASALIKSEAVPELLTRVADLISERAQKQLRRRLRLHTIPS